MNSEFPQNERAKLEAKLTALLLGELHADEVAALSKAMEADPELAALYERLKITIELVREGAAKPAELTTPLKLSTERREKLLAQFKTVTPAAFAKPRRRMEWLAPWAAAAVIAIFFAFMAIPNFIKTRGTAKKNTIVNNLRLLDGAKEQWALENNKSGDAVPTMEDLGPYLGRGENGSSITSLAGEKYVLGKVSELPKVEASVSQAKSLFGREVVAQGEMRDGKVIVSPYPGATDIGGQAAPTAGRVLTVVSAPQSQLARKPAEVHKAPATTPIVLPPEQAPDVGAVPGQMVAVYGNAGIAHLENADPAQVNKVLQQFQRTNSLALNQRYWGLATDRRELMVVPDAEGEKFQSHAVAANGSSVETHNLVGGSAMQIDAEKLRAAVEKGQVALDVPGSYDLGVSNALPGAEPAMTLFADQNIALNYKNVTNSLAYNPGKVPILGDVPALGRAVKSESKLADASGTFEFKTGMTREDVSGLRYLYTNATVASQPVGGDVLAWGAVDGTTNATAGYSLDVARSQAASAGTNSFAGWSSIINGGVVADNNGTHVGGTIRGENRKAEIVLPSAQDSVLMNRENQTQVGKMEIADLATIGSSGGGGAGPAPTARRAVGGKQVELAAAAPRPAQTAAPTSPATVNTPAADFYFENKVTTRGAVVASSGTMPAAPTAIDRVRSLRGQNNVKDQLVEQDKELQVAQAEWERLRKEKGDNSPPHVHGAGNVPTSLSSEIGQRVKGSSDSWWTNQGTVQGFYDDSQNSAKVASPNNAYDATIVGYVNVTNNTADYVAAKKELNEATQWRQVLATKAGREEVDASLPKARMVSVMNLAKAEEVGKPGLGEKIKHTLTGKVERTASIQIEQEHPDIGGLAGAPAPQGYDPYFLQIEFEAIKSDNVLKKAVEKLNLDGGDKSKTEEAVNQLRKNLDVSAVKNTKLIEIGASSKKPEEAARIANAVAEAYKEYRAEEYDDMKTHGIKNLEQQLSEQDKKIQEVHARVDELRKNFKMSNVMTSSAGTTADQADTALPKPSVPPPTPQPEILTSENAFSTFSLNVSDVSFKLAGASLTQGQMPEPASIRSEEFINAFDYRDPEAGPGVPIAFASERARYPFAHNRELLRFSLKTAAAGRQAGRSLNIVLLLDNSGSMERADRVRIIQEAMRVLAGQLQASDTFSIVTFARTAQLRVDGIPGNQAAAAAEEIAKLTPEGGTNLGEALDLAYQTALHHYLANGDNRVVLLTDGAANLGDVQPESLKQKVEAHRQQGVALDCFGIGWEGYNDDLLETLTRNGDGRYGFINTPEEANTEFVAQIAGALHVAASDVKVQVEFNPKRVTSYRQIGYAKHQLTKEQFRDNTVDAAEIASQEAGNALYTTEINPDGEGSIATVRVRYKVPGTAEYREQSWDVPYTGGAVALDQATPAMRLAATASAFSEWLATSPFAAEVSTEELLKYLSGVPQVYGADARPAKLEWMIRQARSISGK